jgi:uncharacterized repeat protein (TIGR01451 family)
MGHLNKHTSTGLQEDGMTTGTQIRRARPYRAAVTALACGLALVLPAAAMASGPILQVNSVADTSVAPGDQFTYHIDVMNPGDTDSAGETDLTVQLPDGVTAVSARAENYTVHQPVNCTAGDGSAVAGATSVLCRDPNPIAARTGTGAGEGDKLSLLVQVDPSVPAPRTLTATIVESGGGAPTTRTAAPILVTASPPAFGVAAFDGQVSSDQGGDPLSQAGATPYDASTEIDYTTGPSTDPTQSDIVPIEPPKDVSVNLPPGFVGIPGGLARCTGDELVNVGSPATTPPPDCPAASQVGVAFLHQYTQGSFARFAGFPVSVPVAVYNMVPPPGVPARFGFNFSNTIVVFDAHLRSGSDYGLSIEVKNESEGLSLEGATFTFWGVPADPSHDFERFCPDSNLSVIATDPTCVDSTGQPLYTRPALTAFLRNPTSCAGPLTTTLYTDSWLHPGAFTADGTPDLSNPNWKTASFVSHNPPAYPSPSSDWGPPQGVTGCAKVPFNPTISVQPTTSAADSPTGLNVDLHLPQTQDPSSLAEADLKRAVVTLPAGMTVNASSAIGLGACTSAQADLSSDGPASCPDSAKLGTVEIDTPLLSHPLDGSVYLAKQGDNPFGSLLALYIVASQDGVNVKLAGRIDVDQSTGQLTTTFDNQPQMPFSDLKLSLFSGDRASLTTPPACGQDTIGSTFDSWATPGVDVDQAGAFSITSGPNGTPCPPDQAHLPFSPVMSAGATSPSAGGFSPFVLEVQRDPGQQAITSLNVSTPPGLLARLAGVSQCSDAALASIPTGLGTGAGEAASPSCPANSQVGEVQIGAGSGSPFYLSTGKAYLAGPYRGAPYSLAIVTPVLAGPFDLGNVVVRSALYLDPTSAQVTVDSDRIPTILQGIPLAIRDIRVILDRPSFTLNPTSCDPMSVSGLALGANDASSPLTSRFQVGNCNTLRFNPKLALALSGRGRTRSGDHPTLTATLTQPFGGQANIRTAQVALPLSLALDPANSQHVCDYDIAQAVHGGAVACPTSTIVGQATAQTPLLDQPLTGPVYLVQGVRFGRQGQRIHTLPTLLIPLRGQIGLDLRASSSVNGAQQLVTTFSTIPDAPVSKFTLTINGGPKGVLVITGRGQSICGKKQIASADFAAQSAKASTQNDTLATPCPKVNAKFRKRHKQRHSKKH